MAVAPRAKTPKRELWVSSIMDADTYAVVWEKKEM
jgi:hypothetical protein